MTTGVFLSGKEQSILTMDIAVANTFSGFEIRGGMSSSENSLNATYFAFSGYEGYIFDQSGKFVGGYQPNIDFNITIHSKSDSTLSYFIDDNLIANNYYCPTGFNYLLFEKHGSSTLDIDHIY